MNKGYRAELVWYEFIQKMTERFGCPLIVRRANENEDKYEGWDMKLMNPRTKKTMLIDVTYRMRDKRIEQWIHKDQMGIKAKVDLKGEVRYMVVVDARASAKQLFTYAEQILS